MDNFNTLPIEIALDILARLPAELILESKLVSKTWRNLIQNPSFFRMHLNRLNHYTTTTDFGKLSFIALANDKNLYYFEYDENHKTPIDSMTRIKFTSPLEFKNVFLGSLNGLICLRDSTSNFCICNPMTKEYVIVAEPRIVPGPNWLTGFGYLPSTDEYKLVAMYRECREPYFVHIMLYTLGSRTGWRNVAKFHSEIFRFSSGQGAFLNGDLYWVKDRSGRIAVFDLAREIFREQLPPPPGGSLGVFGGFLSCASIYVNREDKYRYYDTWLYRKRDDIKEEQEQNQSFGWTKEFRLRDKDLLDFTKCRSVLSYSSKCVNIYDPITSTSKGLVDLSAKQFCRVFPHTNTFVSLKEMGEEDSQVMESE